MSLKIHSVDHFVLTVSDITKTDRFYVEILGMEKVFFGNERIAYKFGDQKINVHTTDKIIDPLVKHATPGSADFCLIAEQSIETIAFHLSEQGVEIIAGPSVRTGANGPIQSVYCYDPDENLVEISTYR